MQHGELVRELVSVIFCSVECCRPKRAFDFTQCRVDLLKKSAELILENKGNV